MLTKHKIRITENGTRTVDGMEFYLFYEEYGTDVMACPGEIAAPLALFEAVY
jgi:hypothetical protein